MDYDDIGSEADAQIQRKAGPDRANYIEGLEEVIGFLECNLEAARGDQRREDQAQ